MKTCQKILESFDTYFYSQLQHQGTTIAIRFFIIYRAKSCTNSWSIGWIKRGSLLDLAKRVGLTLVKETTWCFFCNFITIPSSFIATRNCQKILESFTKILDSLNTFNDFNEEEQPLSLFSSFSSDFLDTSWFRLFCFKKELLKLLFRFLRGFPFLECSLQPH